MMNKITHHKTVWQFLAQPLCISFIWAMMWESANVYVLQSAIAKANAGVTRSLTMPDCVSCHTTKEIIKILACFSGAENVRHCHIQESSSWRHIVKYLETKLRKVVKTANATGRCLMNDTLCVFTTQASKTSSLTTYNSRSTSPWLKAGVYSFFFLGPLNILNLCF